MLGGMGAAASCDSYSRIIALAQDIYGAVQDEDYPHILIYNLPLFGFDETGFVNPEGVKDQLLEGLRTLERGRADFIFMACNTVYYYHQFLQQEIGVPLLNIIDETVKEVAVKGHKKVGLLCSQSTSGLQLYQAYCGKYGIEVVGVDNDEQQILNRVILQVMAGRQSQNEIALIKQVINRMGKAHISGVILGCTELPLAIKQDDVDLPLFDSSDIIARAALKFSL